MKKRQSRLVYYLPAIFILAALATIFRCVALSTDFNFATGYYVSGSLSTLADWIMVTAVIVSLSYFVFGEKRCTLVAVYDGPTTYIPSLLVGSALVFITVGLGGKLSTQDGTQLVVSLANLLCFVLAAIGAYAFFITAYKTARRDSRRASVQIGALLFFAVYAAYIYFDNPLPINTPNRVIDITAYLLFSVFFIYEVRISLGRDLWRAYTAFGLSALAITVYSSIPSLAVYLASGIIVSHSIYETVLTASLAIFVLMRLIRSLFFFEDVESDIVKAIRLAEEKKASETNASDESTESEDEEPGESENYTMELDEVTDKTEKESE